MIKINLIYKECRRCKKVKSIKSFYSNNPQKDGYDIYCKKCRKVKVKEWRQANPIKYKQRVRERYIKKYGITLINKHEKREFEKYCYTCKCWKRKFEFYKNKNLPDKLSCRCRDCRRIYQQEYAKTHREAYKRYYKENGRKRPKNYYQKTVKPWEDKNKEKKYASKKLKYHIKNGDIKKLDHCQICNKNGGKISGHHPDYDKPLEVIWTCPSCHRRIHSNHLETISDIGILKKALC